jgi:hypothetical protein
MKDTLPNPIVKDGNKGRYLRSSICFQRGIGTNLRGGEHPDYQVSIHVRQDASINNTSTPRLPNTFQLTISSQIPDFYL